jgi:hypothetical protein
MNPKVFPFIRSGLCRHAAQAVVAGLAVGLVAGLTACSSAAIPTELPESPEAPVTAAPPSDSVTPGASPTSEVAEATPLPYALPSSGRSLWDGARGRIFVGGRGEISILDASTGAVIAEEHLTDFDLNHAVIDVAARRLYADWYGTGLTVRDLDTLELIGQLELPRPFGPSEALLRNYPYPRDIWPAPLLDSASDRLLVFRDNRVFVIDIRNLTVTQVIEDAVAGADGTIFTALLDAEQRKLYLTAYDSRIESSIVGTRLVGLDIDDWRPVFEAEAQGEFLAILAWDDHLVAIDRMYKRYGIHLRLWRGGQLIKHLIDGPDNGVDQIGLALDTSRNRLIMSDAEMLWVMDPSDLELRYFAPQPLPGRLLGYEPGRGLLRFEAGHVGLAGHSNYALAAASLPAARRDARQTWPVDDPYLIKVHAPAGRDSDELFAAGNSERCVLHSEDFGGSWSCLGIGPFKPSKMHSISEVATLPRKDGSTSLLAAVAGYGLFRAASTSAPWEAASEGLTSLSIQEIRVSPEIRVDGLVFARSWRGSLFRSTDWGRSWMELGTFRLPTFDLDYASSRQIFTFEGGTGRFLRSADAGSSWTRLGELPDSDFEGLEVRLARPAEVESSSPLQLLAYAASGYALISSLEPNLNHRFYLSLDGGQNWRLSLDPLAEEGIEPFPDEYHGVVWTGPLTSDSLSRPLTLIELGSAKRSDSNPVFLSRDGGIGWQRSEVDYDTARRLRVLDISAAGDLLVTMEEGGPLRWVTADEWLELLSLSLDEDSAQDTAPE